MTRPRFAKLSAGRIFGSFLRKPLNNRTSSAFTATEESEERLSGSAKSLFKGLYEELADIETRIDDLDKKVAEAFRQSEPCRRIGAIEGVGPVTATAVVAAIANGSTFQNGRQFTAWLGLVPRQHSSGDKQRLLGITKRSDPYLRTLLIHGARSVVIRQERRSKKSLDCAEKRGSWVCRKHAGDGAGRTPMSPGNLWRSGLGCAGSGKM